jgi:diguanylate cyclase (GGDEF)-like protein/PAS domain S-box-containing protein
MSFVYLVITVIYLLMGAYALSLNPRARINQVYLATTLFFALWSLAASLRCSLELPDIIVIWRLASSMAGLAGAATMLHFILLLSRESVSRVALAFVYLPAAALFLFLAWIGFFDAGAVPGTVFIGSVTVSGFFAGLIIAGCVILAAWGRRSYKNREKRQSRIIYGAIVPSLVLMACIDPVLPLALGSLAPELAEHFTRLILMPAVPLGWIAAMWFAVTRYRLLALSPDLATAEIMNNILDLLVLVDPEGRVIEANRQAQAVLGCRREALLESRLVDLVVERDLVGGICDEIMRGGMPLHKGEATFIAAADTRIPVRLAIAAVKDQIDDPIGLLVAAQDIRQEKLFEALSVTDRLTGLFNRLKIDEVLAYETARSARTGQPFTVCLLDIDHFKQVNDRFGHQAGDEVLRRLASLLSAGVRASDTVGRWGGEEFLLVLPETTTPQAAILVEKLREAIEGTDFAVGRPVSASFGLSAHRPGDTVQALVGRADQALYTAKSAGRNRVCGA